MPSPFPGMDPFIEGQAWRDFHHTIITVIRELLAPGIAARYVTRIEERVYLEHQPEERERSFQPDLVVAGPTEAPLPRGGGTAVATAVAIRPVAVPLPLPERVQELYLTIRERETLAVVTVIEVLSPTNKRVGGDGRKQYLEEREEVLLGSAHLIELDLLRGGERLPMDGPLPTGDYYAFVSRGFRPTTADVYAWPLRNPLPTIPVPLAGKDPDVPLDLQAAFTTLYDRAVYAVSLDYGRPVDPALDEADAAWAHEVLAAARSTS